MYGIIDKGLQCLNVFYCIIRPVTTQYRTFTYATRSTDLHRRNCLHGL